MNLKNLKEFSLSNLSPYPLKENNEGFTFKTDRGIIYQLTFESNADHFPHNSFGTSCLTFSIIPLNDNFRISQRGYGADPKIEETVVYVLRQTFENNPRNVVNYTCSLDNEQERHRAITFGRWYQLYLKDWGIARVKHTNKSERVYATALYRADHPNREEIEEVFSELFKGK